MKLNQIVRTAGRGNTAVIEVRDNGAGLAPEMLTKDDGGTVSASSGAPGGGAVFTIRLPLEERAAAPNENRDDDG